jgi:steroid delta-isomerase-like uncharacterized protein
MSDSPEAVMRTWFDEVWNQGREGTIDRLFPVDALAHGLPGGPIQGPGGFRALFHAFRGAFPDIRIEVEHTIATGESIAAHVRVTGTHSGGTLGFPATGRRIDFRGMTMATVTGGQVQECWNCFDFLTMYQQLGVVPPIPTE